MYFEMFLGYYFLVENDGTAKWFFSFRSDLNEDDDKVFAGLASKRDFQLHWLSLLAM